MRLVLRGPCRMRKGWAETWDSRERASTGIWAKTPTGLTNWKSPAETVKSPRRRSDGLFDLILFRAGRGRRRHCDRRHQRGILRHRKNHHRRNCGFRRRRPNCGLAPNTSAMVPSKSAKEPSTSGTEPGNSGWERNRCETVANTTATAEDYRNVAANCRTAARLNARRWNNSGCCCSSAPTDAIPDCLRLRAVRRCPPMGDDYPWLRWNYLRACLPGDSNFRILLEPAHGLSYFPALPRCVRCCQGLETDDCPSPKAAGSAKARADAASFANYLAHCRSGRSFPGAHLMCPRADLPYHLSARSQTGRMSVGRCWLCEFVNVKRPAPALYAPLRSGSGPPLKAWPRVN